MTNRGLFWRTTAFVISVLILMAIVLDVADRANKNRIAIEKSCVLLNNAIIRSGAAGGGNGPGSILVAEILRNARLHHRDFVIVQYKDALGKMKQVEIINCNEVAKHPDRIKADPIPTTSHK